MFYQNFIKVGISVPEIKVGNPNFNAEQIIKALDDSKASVVLFPELNLSSLYAGNLFTHPTFLNECLDALEQILKKTTYRGFFTVGMPLAIDNNVYNSVISIANNKILGVSLKMNLSIDDQKYFADFKEAPRSVKLLNQNVSIGTYLYSYQKLTIGIDIGSNLGQLAPISDLLVLNGANLILNPSSDQELLNSGQEKYRRVLELSKRHKSAFIYASPSKMESTSKYVYAGDMVAAVDGLIIDEASSLYDGFDYLEFDIDLNYIEYQRTNLTSLNSCKNKESIKFELPKYDTFTFEEIDTLPFFGSGDIFGTCSVINQLLKQALTKKILSLPKHLRKIVIGVSGGADSTLALLISEQVLEELNLEPTSLIAVSMPSTNSSKESNKRAIELIDGVKASKHIIPIDEQLEVHLKSINHKDKDLTYENAQARIRTNILMDLANKYGGIVLGPSDLSEIALGFTTYNGDASSMYGINSGIPKTIVLEMLRYFASEVYIDLASVICEIAHIPPSPELVENQITEDIVGKYEINDFILYHFMMSGWDKEKFLLVLPQAFNIEKEEAKIYVDRFFKRFYQNQFKRMVLPEGPNVLGISLNPTFAFKLTGDNEIE